MKDQVFFKPCSLHSDGEAKQPISMHLCRIDCYLCTIIYVSEAIQNYSEFMPWALLLLSLPNNHVVTIKKQKEMFQEVPKP